MWPVRLRRLDFSFLATATGRDLYLEGKLLGALSIFHNKLPFKDKEAQSTKTHISPSEGLQLVSELMTY